MPGDFLNHAKPIKRCGIFRVLGQDFLEMQCGGAMLAAALKGLCETNAGIGVLGWFLKDAGVKGGGFFEP